MSKLLITKSFRETQKMGERLVRDFQSDFGIICLEGELGSGKTTFAQGILKGLEAKGPYTSPTFVIMKEYLGNKNVYHIDAYRVEEKDVLNLGWQELISDPKNVIIVEWPERIKSIIPASALWIKFKWLGENKREINICEKHK